MGLVEVRDVLNERIEVGPAVSVAALLREEVLAQIVGMNEVDAELEVVISTNEVQGVGDLVAALIRVGGAIEKGGCADLNSISDVHVGRNAIRIFRGLIQQGRLLIGGGILVGFVLEVAAILVADLIAESGRDFGIQLGDAEGCFNEVVAETRYAVADSGRPGLDTCG
jgi:hypothetical protein